MIGGAAGRDQHMPRSDGLAGPEPKRMRVLEHRARLDDTGAGFFHIGCIGSLQSRDLLVLVGDQGRPVERRGRYSPAEAGGVLDFVLDVRRIDQELFRNAAADHAGAAHPVFFGDHDPRAMTGGDPGGTHSARTSPDDEQIDVELSHGYPARILSLTRFLHANRHPLRSKTLWILTRFLYANRHPLRSKTLWKSYLLAAFAHLGPEFAIDDFAKLLCPLVHKGHAELNCPRLGGEQFLPQWRFVERDQVFQFLLGELVGVDRRHSLADFLFAVSKLLRDDHGYFVEVLL